MIKPKISVIIPVYNVEDYIDETLTSLLNQTMIDDIEVLMIDDGSTDNSRYIIEKYALDYDNFHAIHKENGGQGVARNLGLELAKGEYIHFIDSDDYIIPETYEKLYDMVTRKDYDFVVFNANRFTRYNCKEEYLFKISFKNLNDIAEFNDISENPLFVWDTLIWNKLYKKEFLIKNDIKFPDKKIFFEDIIFSLETYIHANSFIYLNEFLYYWRIRSNLSSVTQQNRTMKNFKDRLEIMFSINDLMEKIDLDEKTKDAMYKKWLQHDLKVYLTDINHFPEEYLNELLDEVSKILKIVPEHIIENLNSYRKIIYKMVENKDLKELLYFAPLENKLKENQKYELKINKKYRNLIDFEEDAKKENLFVKKTDIKKKDDSIIIKFEERIDYLAKDYPHKTEAILIDENGDEFDLEIKEDEIIIPLNLITSKKHCKIKMKYVAKSFEKEVFLRNYKRGSILLDNFDLEICSERNNFFSIRARETDDNEIKIHNIDFNDEVFIFRGQMKKKIENIIIENVIDFKKFEYPINFIEESEEGYDFNFNLPYADIANTPIKKWEIKSREKFKDIKLSKRFEFYREKDKILFLNLRNKVIIEDDLCNKVEKIKELDERKEKLKRENKILKNKNKNLKNRIKSYKSRKIVKTDDKIKNFI